MIRRPSAAGCAGPGKLSPASSVTQLAGGAVAGLARRRDVGAGAVAVTAVERARVAVAGARGAESCVARMDGLVARVIAHVAGRARVPGVRRARPAGAGIRPVAEGAVLARRAVGDDLLAIGRAAVAVVEVPVVAGLARVDEPVAAARAGHIGNYAYLHGGQYSLKA